MKPPGRALIAGTRKAAERVLSSQNSKVSHCTQCVLGALGDLALRPVPLRDPGGAQGGGEATV